MYNLTPPFPTAKQRGHHKNRTVRERSIIRAATVVCDGSMAPTLRIELNPGNRKVLVAAKDEGAWLLQVLKRGRLLDVLNEDELINLYEEKHVADLVTAHLNNHEDIEAFLGETSYIRLLNHLLHFIKLGGKPFVLLSRDSAFEEKKGVPQFKDVYLGLTAWMALKEHAQNIAEFFAGPVCEIEWC